VGHAGGIHGFGDCVGRESPAIVQITEALRQLSSLGECQQPFAFLRQPGLVARSA